MPPFLTGMPIWSSMFSMTPSRKAGHVRPLDPVDPGQLGQVDGLDAGLGRARAAAAGLGQRRHAH